MDSGVVADPDLESSLGRSQPGPGGDNHESRDTMRPTTTSSSSTPVPSYWRDPVGAMRQWYAAEPQVWQWYYHDPIRHQLPSSPLPGPYLPPTSGTASLTTTNAMLEPVSASLKALQSQFTAFQEGLGGVESDVKDALSQLNALRTAQNKTDKSIAEIEGVIGISSTGMRSMGRAKRGRGRGRGGKTGIPTEASLQVDAAGIGTIPEKTLIQSVASIQSAIEALLARSHLPGIYREEPLQPSVDHSAGQASFRMSESSPPSSVADPSIQHPTLQSMQFTFAASPSSQSESSSPLSSIAISAPESGTSLSPAAPGKEYADASIQACTPSFTSKSSYSLSYSHGHAPGLTPVDWNNDLAALGRFANDSVRPTAFTPEYLTHFLRDAHLHSALNTVTDSQAPRGDDDHSLRSLTPPDTQLPARVMFASALSSYPREPNPEAQRPGSTTLRTAFSSSDTSTILSAGDTTPGVETPPPLAGIPIQSSKRLQAPSSTTEGVDSSMTPFQTRLPGDSQMSPTSPLSSLSSTRDTQTPPSPENISIQSPEKLQAPSLTTEGVDSSIIPPQMSLPDVSPTSLTSPLSSLSSSRDTPMLVSGASGSEVRVGYPGRPHAELDPVDAQMAFDTDDSISVPSGPKTAPGSPHTVSGHRRQSSPLEADDRGLPSGLPTPPAETITDERESLLISRSTCECDAAMDPKLILRTHLPRNLPVIPTPPFLTPEPSAGEDRGMSSATGGGGSLGAVSEPPLPLTPPLFSPSSTDRSSLADEGDSDVNRQAAAHKVVDEQTDSPDDTGRATVCGGDAVEVVNAGAPMDDTRSSPRSDQADIEVSTFATPVIISTNESQSMAVSNEDVDVDPSRTPRSSASQPNTELPEHRPGVSVNDVDHPYSPMNAYGNGYDFHFSSPLRRPSPPTSSTPSQYATPSETSDARPTQDEDEVWHALMLGLSGVSTPLSAATSLPMMFSNQPSRAPSVRPHSPAESQPLSIGPSVLQLRGPLLAVHGDGVPVTSSPRVSDRSLSPLTSLGDTDVDKDRGSAAGADVDAARSKTPRPHVAAPVDATKANTSGSSRSTSYRGRRSEPFREPSRPVSRVLGASGRAPSEATVVDRRVGGPRASLGELASIARRVPFRIWLRLPEGKMGVKRKRGVDADADDDDGDGNGEGEGGGGGLAEGAGRENGGADSERERFADGDGMCADEDAQVGQEDGDVPPARIGARTTPAPTASQLAPEMSTSSGVVDSAGEHPGMTSHLPVSRKATKKESERRHKKRRRVLKANPKSPVTYHVRNGQIVALASEPGPQSRAPAMPPASQPEVDQDAREPTRTHHRKKQENRAMKAPPSSPAYPNQPSARLVKSSPTKEEVRNTNSRCAGTWPELPIAFSQWDVQFIQCDSCDKWYHYGCVAIEAGDPRLEPSALFICPACHNQSAKRQTLRNQSDQCSRPDCPEPQVTSESELYFVEKLVGRKKIEGYVYMWLAKWEGYPMIQATWIPKENLVGGDTKLFDAFLEDAAKEGADLSQDVVLLQEALDAGWEA